MHQHDSAWHAAQLAGGRVLLPAHLPPPLLLAPPLQLYEAIPTALLPVLPHLSLEIQVESDAKRLTAVELLGKIFTQRDGREIMNEYREQADDLLKRLHDAKVGGGAELLRRAAGTGRGEWAQGSRQGKFCEAEMCGLGLLGLPGSIGLYVPVQGCLSQRSMASEAPRMATVSTATLGAELGTRPRLFADGHPAQGAVVLQGPAG